MRAKGVDVTDVAPDIACFGMDGWMDLAKCVGEIWSQPGISKSTDCA